MNHQIAAVAYDSITANDSREDRAVKEVINAAKLIHMELGPGLFEEVYEDCLCSILTKRDVPFKCNVDYPVTFLGEILDHKIKLNMIVDDCLIVEIKAVGKPESIHEANLLTCLKLSKAKQCLLVNFNVPLLEQGIKRLIKRG